MHAVDEVDVEGAGRSPQRLRAPRAPVERVGGGVVDPQVGLRLHDAQGQAPVGPLQHLPQPALLPQIAGADHDQPVLRLVAAVGGEGLLVAMRLRLAAVAQIAGQMRAHQDHRDIEHRQVDVLALAGALPLNRALASAKAAIVPVA